jgi:uncharacterized membrane protein YgaE (UPF0421/DUF939 family)
MRLLRYLVAAAVGYGAGVVSHVIFDLSSVAAWAVTVVMFVVVLRLVHRVVYDKIGW